MNKVILSGNISNDIDFKTTNNGTPVAKFNLAVPKKDGTDFISTVVWNQCAENVNQFCSKGSKILVEGRLQTRDYEKDGVKHYVVEVVADKIEFLSKKPSEKETEPEQKLQINTKSEIGEQIVITDKDLPF